MKIKYQSWTKSPGICGGITRPEDFIVREIISPKYTQKFSRTARGIAPSSRYGLFLLKKRNMTTQHALEEISEKLSIKKDSIGYAGLKDKTAVTEQYITLPPTCEEFETDKMSVKRIGSTERMISIGDLLGNAFEITLHGCSSNAKKIMEEIGSKPMPNYFGPQRFGREMNNHVIGRLIVKRSFRKALGMINKTGKRYKNIENVPRKMLKFYIQSYQSYLFNKALSSFVKNHKKIDLITIVGFKTRLRNTEQDNLLKSLVKKEHIRPQDFQISDLRLACKGGARTAFIVPKDLAYSTKNNDVRLTFILPAGSYATVLINEITKTPAKI